jgi:CBS domain-containing protein
METQAIKVKEVMSTPVITINENACVPLVATLMKQHKVGCVVITDDENKPLGIITERDLVVRVMSKMTNQTFANQVLASNEESNLITAKDVMTAPLVTVPPEKTLSEAAKQMRQVNIRRLVVISQSKLLGIVSSKDILAVTPELIAILQEEAKIQEPKFETIEQPNLAGYCDQCGNWSDLLTQVDGDFLCEECHNETKF